MMKYLYLLLLSVMFIPISQVAYGQNIIDQIGQAFNNLTSGMMGGNQSNQTSTNGSSDGTNSSGASSSSSNSSGASSSSSNSSGASSSSSNSSGASSSNASSGTGNQSTQDVGSIQDLQNLTSGNQELLTNN